MQKIVDQEKGAFQIAACDWDLYSEKVRKAKYNFDESEVRPYYELNHVILDGVFFAAGKLYGLTFKERHDLPVYEPDVRVLEVSTGWQTAGDFPRRLLRPASKRGGAWMNAYVAQSGLFGTKPVVANHLNIPKPPPGRTDTAYPRSSADRFSRIRSRAARHVFEREISAVQRNKCAARFCRVSVAGKRNVGHLAGGPRQLRKALQDRGTNTAGVARQGRPRKSSIRDLRPLNICRLRFLIRRGIN